jgi:hypothetical protein
VVLSSFWSRRSSRQRSAKVRPMVMSVFIDARRCWMVCLSVRGFPNAMRSFRNVPVL